MVSPATKQPDMTACLCAGLATAVGAVPGTCFSHPFDVLKIRMQTTTSGSYATQMKAIAGAGEQHLARVAGLRRHSSAVRGFYRGLIPALELRFIARGSMFMMSELCTQTVESRTQLSGISARIVGSLASGYVTGSVAGFAEYRKKLVSQGVTTAHEARYPSLLGAALRAGQGSSLARRLHAAGCRSSVNDACFFSTQHYLHRELGWSLPASYACAAACGVVAAFGLDAGVARMMVVPPHLPVRTLQAIMNSVVLERRQNFGGACQNPRAFLCMLGLYRGILARVTEFAVCFGVTGTISEKLAPSLALMLSSAAL